MAVDKEAVRRIAKLARIGISEAELEPMARELNTILSFVETLDQIDTAGVPALTSVVAAHLKQRTDAVTDGGAYEGEDARQLAVFGNEVPGGELAGRDALDAGHCGTA